jgi:hypothetical protein
MSTSHLDTGSSLSINNLGAKIHHWVWDADLLVPYAFQMRTRLSWQYVQFTCCAHLGNSWVTDSSNWAANLCFAIARNPTETDGFTGFLLRVRPGTDFVSTDLGDRKDR